MSKFICEWSTYKGNHCKKFISNKDNDKYNGHKFCDKHIDLMSEYTRIHNTDDICETFKEIKLTPRSYKHVKNIMSSLGYEDENNVDVYLSGGCIEEADISNTEYILLVSDNSRFYYNHKRGQHKSKDLKIILKEYCKNQSVISTREIKYCEECYKKIIDVPKISLIN